MCGKRWLGDKNYMWQKMISQCDEDVNRIFQKNFREKMPNDVKINVNKLAINGI